MQGPTAATQLSPCLRSRRLPWQGTGPARRGQSQLRPSLPKLFPPRLLRALRGWMWRRPPLQRTGRRWPSTGWGTNEERRRPPRRTRPAHPCSHWAAALVSPRRLRRFRPPRHSDHLRSRSHCRTTPSCLRHLFRLHRPVRRSLRHRARPLSRQAHARHRRCDRASRRQQHTAVTAAAASTTAAAAAAAAATTEVSVVAAAAVMAAAAPALLRRAASSRRRSLRLRSCLAAAPAQRRQPPAPVALEMPLAHQRR